MGWKPRCTEELTISPDENVLELDDVAFDPSWNCNDLTYPAAPRRVGLRVHHDVDRGRQPSARRTACPTFSPASSGRVHSLVTASRAELAWSEHMPGKPLFSAISRSRHSASRTSPTMMRDGRMRSASLTSRRSRISPVPSRLGWRRLHRDDVGQREAELEDLLDGDDPLLGRDGGGQAVQHRRLARLRAARRR